MNVLKCESAFVELNIRCCEMEMEIFMFVGWAIDRRLGLQSCVRGARTPARGNGWGWKLDCAAGQI
jgi:hypothetical protein